MKGLPKEISEFMGKYGIDAGELWEVRSGAFAIKHKALERVATTLKIEFERPSVLAMDLKEKMVAMWVGGKLPSGQAEWSTGEACPYNNKNGYPVAMAEKRARDRVILKLCNVHGALYSESEADEFVQSGGKMETLPKKDAKEIYTKLQREINECKSRDQLKIWGEANKDRIRIMPEDWQDILRLQYEEKSADLRQQEAA